MNKKITDILAECEVNYQEKSKPTPLTETIETTSIEESEWAIYNRLQTIETNNPRVEESEFEITDELRNQIDEYFNADDAEKRSKKEKGKIKEDIQNSVVKFLDANNDKLELNGNNYALQIVKKHAYSLNQNKCKADERFVSALSEKAYDFIEQSHSLSMDAQELDDVVFILAAAGRSDLVEKIETTYKFNCTPDKIRKYREQLSESAGYDIKHLIEDKETIQFVAKAKLFD